MREGGFACPDEPIDTGGLEKAARINMPGSRQDRMLTSPALAARQTAEAILPGAEVECALRDMDPGAWRGRSLGELFETDAEALSQWISHPARGAPGGETMDEVVTRVGGWLDEQSRSDARVVAVTHPSVIRAVIALVLDVSVSATFNIDIAPLSSTRLSFNRRWRLQELRLP